MNRRIAIGTIAASLGVPFAPAPAGAAGTIRAAAPALDSTALMFYAQEMGFFKAAGLEVDLQPMANGEAVTVALTGGAIDVGCSEAVSLIVAYKRGLPITIIAPGGMQTPSSPVGMFFVQKGSTAQGGRDLDGKTIACVGLKGLAQSGTMAWLDKTGGDSRSVKFVQMSGAQIAVALQDGRIDGAFVPEPFVSAVKRVARPLANPMEAIAPTFLSSAHFALLPWVKAHSEETRRFQRALRQTADWANKNHDRTALILEKIARVDPAVVQASTRSFYGDRLNPALLQPLIDVAARYLDFSSFPANEILYKA
jgi:NitT/TauT family transport system substrate-binding protein